MKNKIGILTDNLHLETREAIQKAKDFGADGFQIFCSKGAMVSESMDSSARQEFKQFVANLGLEISALCGDMGKGFLNAEANQSILPRMKEFIDLANDLEVRIVTSHIGRLPNEEGDPKWQIGLEAMDELGSYAQERGCVLAMETGPEEPVLLKRFLEQIPNRGIGVNYDPANLIMKGFDHIGGVFVLREFIVHTHAKDAVLLLGEPSAGGDPYKMRRMEVPLGSGSVAFSYYLWALEKIGYEGYLTIEREAGPDPLGDIAEGVRFLRSLQVWDGKRFHSKEKRWIDVDVPDLGG